MSKHPSADFWDRYEEVPLGDYKAAHKVAMEKGNRDLRRAWEAREEGTNPAAWYHLSWRVRWLRQAIYTYAPQVGIARETVPRLEDPEQDFAGMRYHPSLHAITRYWGECAESQPGDVRRLLLEGRQKYLDAVVATVPLATSRFVLQRRILEGSASFEDKIQYTTIFQRLKHGRITSLREIIERVLELCPPQAGGAVIKVQGDVREALEAYLHDLRMQRTPEAVALLRAAVELTGRDFSREGLHDLGASYATSETILDHEPVAPHFRSALASSLHSQIDPTVYRELLRAMEQWEQDPYCGQPLREDLRRLLLQQGMHNHTANSMLLQAFDVQAREGDKVHDIVRGGIERGPSKTLTPAGLVYVLALTPEECRTSLDRARNALRSRQEKNCTRASVPIRAELDLWGLDSQDLGYGKRDVKQFKELKRGGESKFSEGDALARIREVGLRKIVQPALERWVGELEPDSIGRAIELLIDRTEGGASSIARGAHSSAETIMGIVRGEITPDFALLRDLFNAAGAEIPVHLAIDCHLQYAQWLREQGHAPFAAAVRSIIARTHRYVAAFHRERKVPVALRTFDGYLERGSRQSPMPPEFLDQFLKSADVELRSPCASFLRLQKGSENPLEGLFRWRAQMEEEQRGKLLEGLAHLRAAVERREGKQAAERPPRSIEELQERKAQLHRWRLGLPSGRGSKRERLSTAEDDAAFHALLQLPGVTKDDVIVLT